MRIRNLKFSESDTVGFLEIIKENEMLINPNGDKVRNFTCKCECGKVITVRYGHLSNGHTVSCGCKKSGLIRKGLQQDLGLGKRYGRLTIISEIDTIALEHRKAKCICDCGKETIANIAGLKSGNTRSCGCLKDERLIQYNKTIKPGLTHGKSKGDTYRLYNIWHGMMNRCNRTNDKSYKYYGGRGVIVCDRWHNVLNFLEDMEQTHIQHIKDFGIKDTTLDRIDVFGNYCKENCRWATMKQQHQNTRKKSNKVFFQKITETEGPTK